MLPLFLVARQGCKSLSTSGFLCLRGMCISPKLSRGLELSWGLRGTEEESVRSAVWSQVQENTWHGISSQETSDVGPAQPFASLTSDGSLNVCFLFWGWRCIALCTSRVSIGIQWKTQDKALANAWPTVLNPWCCSHCAIFIHLQASGLARTPRASGWVSVCSGLSRATRNSGISEWPSDFMLPPELSIRFYLLIKLMRNPCISYDKAGGVSAIYQGHRGHSPVLNAPE